VERDERGWLRRYGSDTGASIVDYAYLHLLRAHDGWKIANALFEEF